MTQDQAILSLKATLRNALQFVYPDSDIEKAQVSVPTDKKKADFVSNVAFLLAKEIGKAPLQIAEEISTKFAELTDEYTVDFATPGFINFRISDKAVALIAETIIEQKQAFGNSETYKNQTWVIEHTSPNPNKAMHVGHLRNNLLGISIANLLEFSGANVIRDWVDNDRGIAIAKAMWGYLAFQAKDSNLKAEVIGYNLIDSWYDNPQGWHTPEDVNTKSDHFIGDCYTAGSDAFKNSDVVQEAIRRLALNWELGDEKVWKLWELILNYSHDGIFKTLERIGNRWDNGWHEHEHYKQGKDLVQLGLDKGIFQQLDDGAILTKLDAYNLPDTVVLKSDGTSLYITQDLALTKLKKETYEADKLIWVIGPEQTVAMKQVFAICEQLGIGSFDDFIHVPYGLISISKDGVRKKMSSRGGDALLIDTLLDTVQSAVIEKDRGYTAEDADKIAVAAVKFAMLKPARNTDTVLDITQIVNLEGDSGVYVLYSMARMRALLAKQELVSNTNIEAQYKYDDLEHSLIVNLSYFPGVVRTAAADFSPNLLVEYALDIARSFNAVYARERFLTDDINETQKKLGIAAACLAVLETTTKLLGLPVIEEI